MINSFNSSKLKIRISILSEENFWYDINHVIYYSDRKPIFFSKDVIDLLVRKSIYIDGTKSETKNLRCEISDDNCKYKFDNRKCGYRFIIDKDDMLKELSKYINYNNFCYKLNSWESDNFNDLYKSSIVGDTIILVDVK